MVVEGGEIAVTSERDPGNLPHASQGIDIVLECTGFFQSDEASRPHLAAGAKRVLISAPATGVSKPVVYGVNHDTLTADDVIVSTATCTTHSSTPVPQVLNDKTQTESGFMTTIP